MLFFTEKGCFFLVLKNDVLIIYFFDENKKIKPEYDVMKIGNSLFRRDVRIDVTRTSECSEFEDINLLRDYCDDNNLFLVGDEPIYK